MRLWEEFKYTCGRVPEFARPPPQGEANDWRAQFVIAEARSKARAIAVDLLKAGRIDLFNQAMAKARQADPAFRLDLTWATLDGCDLRGADLKGVIFTNASLLRTDLRGVDFAGADLWEVGIESALVQGADVSQARIDDFRLRMAFLKGALVSPDQLVRMFGGRDFKETLARARAEMAQFRKEFPTLAPVL